MNRYWTHGRMCAAQAFDGGVFYVFSGYALRVLQPVVLMLLWRQLLSGSSPPLSLRAVLTYTLWSSLLAQQLNVHTTACDDFWDGSFGMRFLRPAGVLSQVFAETVGRWVPGLLLYTLPAFALALLIGIPAAPVTPVAGLLGGASLLLSVSLGFAVDFLFMSLSVNWKNASYQAVILRSAVMKVCSGAVIPFAALPGAVGAVLSCLPFGALAGAPLSIYAGLSAPLQPILLQVFWNAALWPLALYCVRRSEEKLVSFGG